MRDNPILRVTAKILFAPIIVFGLYVQFHGDYGPGGGFQAGVIIAAAFILTVSAGAIFGGVKGTAMVLTCSTISAVDRLRVSPAWPVAQNGQFIPQPACEEIHIVTRSG